MEYNLHKTVNLLRVFKIALSQILIALIFVGSSYAGVAKIEKTKFTKTNEKGIKENAPIKVTGKVTDQATGETLVGVSILIKGTNVGAVTDVNGKFTITAAENAVLVVSYIGYTTQEVPVDGKPLLNIKLQSSSKGLNEVVVVGYGVQKKITVTGAVVAVKGDELVKSPATNLSNSIAGRMAGVTATNPGGEPGYDGSTIRIRGTNTLGNSDPLVVIDGVPSPAGQNTIDRINPADVESISVLKDASAAIYGSRAANGVILITTKHGKSGKPEISYTYNHGWSQPTVLPKMANSTEYATLANEIDLYNLPSQYWSAASAAFKTTGSFTRPDNGATSTASFQPADFKKFADGSDPWGHPNTDWFKETLKTWSPQSRQNIQLSGGTENIKYLTSIGYQNQDGYYKNSATGYKQYDFRTNIDSKINKYVNTSFGVSGRQENRFFPNGGGASDIFRMLMRGYPNKPAYWPNGLPGPDIENGQQPVLITTNQTGYNKDTRYYVQTNGRIEITVPGVDGLKFTGNVGLDKYIQQTKSWQTPWFVYSWDNVTKDASGTPVLTKVARGPAQANLNQGSEDQFSSMLEGIVSYNHSFGSHNVVLLAGVNKEKSNSSYFGANRKYYSSTALDQLSAGGNAEIGNYGGAWQKARLSYFGRAGYNYKEKYLAEFLWRVDGSYIFPPDHRFGFFPGISAGWRISEEDFFKNNIKFIQNLKLRGSWGQLGNDQAILPGTSTPAEYAFLSLYNIGSYIIGGVPAQTLSEGLAPNPNFTWEVANNSDVALEGTTLNGKLDFVLEAFLNKRTQILWTQSGTIPATGIPGNLLPPVNYAKVSNKGWEFQVNYHDNIGQVRYNVGVTGSYAKNKIDLWNEPGGVPVWQRSTGHPIGSNLYYVYTGIFATQAQIDANKIDYSGVGASTLRPGDMMYKDVNGDGKINGDDQVRNDKNNQPTFQGGLSFGVQYKNFDLTVLFQGATGAQLYFQTESGTIGNFTQYSYDHRWTVDNPSTVYPRTVDRNNQYFSNGNTYWLLNMNYVRLKNVELGYTLPSSIGKVIGMSNLRFYANGLNLFTLAKQHIYDPESTSSDGHYYPQSRVINLGASIKF
ncbi:SusC/RagA family TonB-linked outer membrane protein [Mucilaginibacter ginsenosidivorax]|uniref:TonB-dependent receptor n=1 Tax=Mucilaginibacter ginsenosidivorax TaxID=862126 RepID=A0A5B8VV24_9SPHI|nr:TonB-dependent receptor [Mucilaginibacter ginsenosidivorax]QEC75123.1 TonB-dependent receptor [Mucilaginibacter ginsenosidivorax]